MEHTEKATLPGRLFFIAVRHTKTHKRMDHMAQAVGEALAPKLEVV